MNTSNDDFSAADGLKFETAASNKFKKYVATTISLKFEWFHSFLQYIDVPCPYKTCLQTKSQFVGIVERSYNKLTGPYLAFSCDCGSFFHIKVDTSPVNEAFRNVSSELTPTKSNTVRGNLLNITPESKSLVIAQRHSNKRLYEKKEGTQILSPKAKRHLDFATARDLRVVNQLSTDAMFGQFGENLIFHGATEPIYNVVKDYHHGLQCYKTIWETIQRTAQDYQSMLKSSKFPYKIIIGDNGQVSSKVTNPSHDGKNVFQKVVENILIYPDLNNLHTCKLPKTIDDLLISSNNSDFDELKVRIIGYQLNCLSGKCVNKAHLTVDNSFFAKNIDFHNLPSAWQNNSKIHSIPLVNGGQSDFNTTIKRFQLYREYVHKDEECILAEDQAGVVWTNAHVQIRRHDHFEKFKHKKSLASLHVHMNAVKAVAFLYKEFLLPIAQEYKWSSVVTAIKNDINITSDYEKIWDFLLWTGDVLLVMLLEKYKEVHSHPISSVDQFIKFFSEKNTTITNFIFRDYFILVLLKTAIRRNRGDLIIKCFQLLLPIFYRANCRNYFNYGIDYIKTLNSYDTTMQSIILSNLCISLSNDINHCVALDYLIEFKNNKLKHASKMLGVGWKKLAIISSHPGFLLTKNKTRRISKRHIDTANKFIKQQNIDDLMQNDKCIFKTLNKKIFQKACTRWNSENTFNNDED